jgi:hypothetical protein
MGHRLQHRRMPVAGQRRRRQYIHDYLGFFAGHAADLAFESYFDEPESYIRSALSTAPIGPNAPAAYRSDILAHVS